MTFIWLSYDFHARSKKWITCALSKVTRSAFSLCFIVSHYVSWNLIVFQWRFIQTSLFFTHVSFNFHHVHSFTKNLACLRLKCYERYEREWDGERWSVYNCRPAEASVELTSPYTGKVVKVHHKAMGKLTILNTSNLLSKILKVHPEAESWKSKMGGWSQFWWHDSSWLHVFQRSVSAQEGKVGDGNLQPLTSWMTTEPSHACLDRCKTPSKSAPFSLMCRPETARRQHHHHPSHSLHKQLHHQHHQHLQGESSNSNWLLVRHI